MRYSSFRPAPRNMRLKHTLLPLLFLLLAPTRVVGDATCPANPRDCNGPAPYTTVNATTESPTVYKSTGVSDSLVDAVHAGHTLVVNFMGGVSGCNAYVFQPNGDDSSYEAMRSTMCAQQKPHCSFEKDRAQAQTGGGQFYRGAGGTTCQCGQVVTTSHALFYLPSSTDSDADVSERAVHEMVHAVQGKSGDATPKWLMEGGAVQAECLLASLLSVNPSTYSVCFLTKGGRGGVIPNFLSYYASSYGKTNGLRKAEDRCCGDFCGTGDSDAVLQAEGTAAGHLYYDVGAVAIAWAINKSGKTSAQFWQSATLGVGFWNAVVPYGGYDYSDAATGSASTTPDGRGWRAAFANFTGHGSVGAFYTEFDAWAASATETSVLAILESNADVATQIATPIDVTRDDFLKTGVSVDECSPSSGAASSATAHASWLAMTVSVV